MEYESESESSDDDEQLKKMKNFVKLKLWTKGKKDSLELAK